MVQLLPWKSTPYTISSTLWLWKTPSLLEAWSPVSRIWQDWKNQLSVSRKGLSAEVAGGGGRWLIYATCVYNYTVCFSLAFERSAGSVWFVRAVRFYWKLGVRTKHTLPSECSNSFACACADLHIEKEHTIPGEHASCKQVHAYKRLHSLQHINTLNFHEV